MSRSSVLGEPRRSRTLAMWRDALLPKLLSGEVRAPSEMFRQAGVPADGIA